jgi:cytosine deaminase
MPADIVVRNAKLRDGRATDIAITDGKYAAIEPSLKDTGTLEINADGRLVTESFVIGQLHLDKVLTGNWLEATAKEEYFDPAMGGTMTAIELATIVKERYDEADILARINTALTEAAFNGVSHIRAFIDVDPKAQLKGINAALKAREQWRDRIELQVVAFPQDGLTREPGTEELMERAMELGADLVGGIPWMEYTDENARRHIDIAFELARKHDTDISMLVDDAGDADLRTLEYLAVQTIKQGWQGRVVACHARAMSQYNEVYHRKVVALLKQAEMGIVTNPHTAPLHIRVRELANDGIILGLGGESVNDAYYPFGRCNMIEAAFAAAHTLWMMSPPDQELLYDMCTVNPAKLLHIPEHHIAPGNAANCVILQEGTMREAFTTHAEPRFVIRSGRLVCESKPSRREFATDEVPSGPLGV